MKNSERLKKILSGEKFPRIGFVEPLLYGKYVRSDFAVTEDEAFRQIKESGIDMIVGAQYCLEKDREIVFKILEACERADVLYLVRDNASFQDKTQAEAARYFKETYAPFLKYSSFAGINPVDEPGYEAWDKIRKFRRAFNEVYPDKLYFVNLLQNYAPAWALPAGAGRKELFFDDPDYDFYCKSYVKQADPKIFCYDFYPFRGEYPAVKTGYFQQLETVLKHAKTKDVPIWCFIQTSGFPEMAGWARVPTFEELLWQVNTSLCYGTKGLAYFCYQIPYDDENWKGAFVDIRGAKTRIYGDCKRLNEYIERLEKYFLNADVCKIVRDGKTLSFSAFDDLLTASENAIVSGIKIGDERYCFIVNAAFDTPNCAVVRCGEHVQYWEDVFGGRISAENGFAKIMLGCGESKLLKIKY